jgi:hypothetical protein
VEVAEEDGLDFREGVEPIDEEGAGLVVEETAVKLGADVAGEAGDFSGAHVGKILDL